MSLELTFGGGPPYAHLWDNGATTPSLENVPPGSYSLTVTDAQGCTAVFHFTVDIGTAVVVRPGVPGFTATVVPNPSGRGTGARLVLTGIVSPKMRVAVHDAAGRLVSGPHYFTGKEHALPVGLAAGTYWVLAENERGERAAVRWMVGGG